ncbi:hypothetical protein [Ferrimicrobium sp.]|uniref:hypothetical protein n=1 Tax=Ferrimicrobium sp. TaxID=2926050 RepID=UPI00263416B1|nr:hypothetical protein [Ferrimicrobium sp.]
MKEGENQFDKNQPFEAMQLAAELIDDSGTCTKLANLRCQERQRKKKRPGGRNAYVSDRTLLILLQALALLNRPLLFSVAAELLEWFVREHPGELEIECGTTTRKVYYDRIYRAWQRCTSLIDPYPYPKRRRLTKEEWEQVKAKRDKSVSEYKLEQLRLVGNNFLETSYRWAAERDPDIWKRFKHLYCIDGTLVVIFGKQGTTARSKYVSREPDGAWYKRDGDHRDDGESRRLSVFWGYEATLVVLASDSKDDRFPRIVVGIDFDKPGVNIAGHAREVFASIIARGHQPTWVVADRAYLPNSKLEALQLPLRAMGFELCFDYQRNQLGIQDNYAGAILVEGNWFCPAMPQALIDATKDFREGKIDEPTYAARIESRRAYLLRPKARPDADGYVPMMCPAAGASPTVTCELKKRKLRPKKAGLPAIANPPESPDKICTNSESVTFGPTAGAKFSQKLLYGSTEWHKRYAHARNTIEGFNGYLKDADYGALHDPGRRRAAGFVSQFLFTTFITLAANIRKIRSFLTEQAIAGAPGSSNRRSGESLKDYQVHKETPPEP